LNCNHGLDYTGFKGSIYHTHQYYTAASDCQTPSDQIPVDQPQQGLDDYEGKDLEKKEGFKNSE